MSTLSDSMTLRPASGSAMAAHDELEIGGPDRAYRVFLHRPAGPPPTDGFPVIFLLDGNALFPLAVAIMKATFFPGEQAILVGIGHAGSEPFDPMRMYDCTVPVSKSELPAFAGNDPAAFGGAAAFREVIEAVLVQVGERYPTGRRRSLIGYSVAGLHVLDTLLTSPASFGTYAAISPALWWKDAWLIERARQLTPDKSPTGRNAILTVGALEQDPAGQRPLFQRMYRSMPEAFGGMPFETAEAGMSMTLSAQRTVDNARAMVEALRGAGIDTSLVVLQDEDHSSVIPAALARVLKHILIH